MTALPKGAIEKLMREAVGDDDVLMSKTAVDWVNECASAFLKLIGQEANTVAEGAATKENYRISHDHVMTALEHLGMRRYADTIRERQAVIELEAQKTHTGLASRKAATPAVSRDELLAEQTALFKQASLDAAKEGW
ncbi:unnamed protein product [Hyaloperonospora brassicae]|uniref:Transcription factor CBF/NF-Y/archaeal histone domain-containing protein n=1 Tax=Hyaloperonospora brassicae TaxID=162125 RepID=A0AAV0TJG3_HYABA|nr:unnamed protein product [Hyaloperonospora brassicae]